VIRGVAKEKSKLAFYWAASCGGCEIADKVDQGILNMVEMALRAYDPCFGCATHSTVGQMPLTIEIYNHEKKLLETVQR